MSDSTKTPPLDGAIKEKLVAAKQRWAKEGRLLTGTTDPKRTKRLPPGQRQVTDWPVLDLGIVPGSKRPIGRCRWMARSSSHCIGPGISSWTSRNWR